MIKRCFKNRGFTVLTKSFLLISGTVYSDLFNFSVDFCNTFKHLLYFRFNSRKVFFTDFIRSVCRIYFMLLFTQVICEFIDFTEPYTNFKRFLFSRKLKEFSCLFTLLLKRTHTPLKFTENIKKTNQIFLCLIKSALCICSFMTEA